MVKSPLYLLVAGTARKFIHVYLGASGFYSFINLLRVVLHKTVTYQKHGYGFAETKPMGLIRRIGRIGQHTTGHSPSCLARLFKIIVLRDKHFLAE